MKRRARPDGECVTPAAVVLVLLSDGDLVADADRVAAAAGARVVRAQTAVRKSWLAAVAVLVDESAARRCVQDGMPRRDGVVLVSRTDPSPSTWAVAIDVGAQHVYVLPAQERELVRTLSEAAETRPGPAAPGRVIAVVPGRGGGGASVFAAALARSAGQSLLVDLDSCGGGVDLLLGAESEPGLRWPDLRTRSGRLSWSAVREALPCRDGVSILSSARAYHEIEPDLVTAVAEAGRRGGTTVVCDVPRQPACPGVSALELADLVVVVTCCDVRGIAAAAAVTGVVRTMNPNVGLVVRGPAPGGLSPREAVAVVAAPLLAALRPEPMLAQRLDRGGLRLGRRSPLGAAARKVLAVAGSAGLR